MDISREEQRVLHALAQGGTIAARKDNGGRIVAVECLTREGWLMTGCDMRTFAKLRRKRAILSEGGRPYRITRRGLELVRSQVDNR